MKHLTTLNITEFKAKCLGLLDDLGENGGTIIVTKRGRPLVTIGPATLPPWKSPEGAWAGKLNLLDTDLVESATSDLWEVLHDDSQERG
jgi:antitoxin (DNA-binding transcriptional repressor) of toxin-antitoxin stability system